MRISIVCGGVCVCYFLLFCVVCHRVLIFPAFSLFVWSLIQWISVFAFQFVQEHASIIVMCFWRYYYWFYTGLSCKIRQNKKWIASCIDGVCQRKFAFLSLIKWKNEKNVVRLIAANNWADDRILMKFVAFFRSISSFLSLSLCTFFHVKMNRDTDTCIATMTHTYRETNTAKSKTCAQCALHMRMC